MSKNINTKEYWDRRFSTQDWEKKSGRQQTRAFAEEQCKRLDITTSFNGTITDFGCGLGDAIPVYKRFFPNAVLRGIDISTEAINKCREVYGSLADFEQGTEREVKCSDVMISSNVFEHLTDNSFSLEILLKRCKWLYVIVPYNEKITEGTEHINSYNESSFSAFTKKTIIYNTNGMGASGASAVYNIYLKNILRPLFGKPLARRCKQIMYKFYGDITPTSVK